QALSPTGETLCTLVNYAIHPEVLGPNAGILSPDLVGPLYDRIEARAAGMAIFMNGAQGGMVTADNRDLSKPRDSLRAIWDDSRTWEECLRIGQPIAGEELRIVAGATVQPDPSLYCAALRVTLPVESAGMKAILAGSPLHYPHGADGSVTTRVNLLNIGNAQVLTIPGEALPNIGFYLK